MVEYDYRETFGMLTLVMRGHASEYASVLGANIVCAGISTVVDMVACGVRMADKYAIVEGGKGAFRVSCMNTMEARLLMRAGMQELARIGKAYPGCLKEVRFHDAENDHAL